MLPLEIVSKGRFEKSEPTIYHGEDLDVPTYIRRGVPFNQSLELRLRGSVCQRATVKVRS